MIFSDYFEALVRSNSQVRVQEIEEALFSVEEIIANLEKKHGKEILAPLTFRLEGLKRELDQKIIDLLP